MVFDVVQVLKRDKRRLRQLFEDFMIHSGDRLLNMEGNLQIVVACRIFNFDHKSPARLRDGGGAYGVTCQKKLLCRL